MAPARRKPFSGKAKKQQLQQKRERHRARRDDESDEGERKGESGDGEEGERKGERKGEDKGEGAFGTSAPRRGDLRTIFRAESRAAIEARRRDAPRPLAYAADRGHSHTLYAVYGVHEPHNQPPLLEKPRWSREMAPEQLRAAEDAAYAEWLATVEREARARGADAALNLFERNVEVWRELWRVLERARVLVHLADARCPLLHVSDRLVALAAARRPRAAVVLVLTKTDLVAADRVRAWAEYLRARFGLRVVAYRRDDLTGSNAALLAAVGQASEELGDRDREAPLVVGLVGEPNVGKSSLLNSLFGRKLVGVSATPGRTKHWQTHFLGGAEALLVLQGEADGEAADGEAGDDEAADDEAAAGGADPRRRVLVCDCPGVVFPRVGVPLALQILFGSFPIAQTREPFSAIRFLAENCVPPLHEAYKLQSVDSDEPDAEWSPYTLCEAYARLRGFHVKGGRPDVSRAANALLRDALAGRKLALSFPPPIDAGGSK